MRVSRSMLMLRQACFETGSIKAGAWLRGHFSSFCCQSQQGELFRFFNLNCRVVHCLQSSFPPLLMNFLSWVEADACKAGWREDQLIKGKHDRSTWNGCHHVIFLLELLGYEFLGFFPSVAKPLFFFSPGIWDWAAHAKMFSLIMNFYVGPSPAIGLYFIAVIIQ